MSERERTRRLYVENVLAELRARHGQSAHEDLPAGPACEPSWGPLGALLEQQLGALEFDRLRALHLEMIALERMRQTQLDEQPELPIPEPPPEFEATPIELA